MTNVSLTVDGQAVTVPDGTTILQASRQLGIEIPTICYHPHFTPPSLCRMCVVQVESSRVLVQACSRQVEEGMAVLSRSPRVESARKLILEMLESAVDLSEAAEIRDYAQEYGCEQGRFGEVKRRGFPLFDDNPFYLRDYSKCIMCWRCVEACGEDVQWTFAIHRGSRGFDSHITTFEGVPIPESTCVYCGNCVQACPTGALKSKREQWIEDGLDLKELARVSQLKRREGEL